jgi:membrane-bound metal-dependent hydrolase YbcI (DUF457 family)
MLGIERVEIEPGITTVTPLDFVSYPITHSLAMVIIWGLVVGLIYWFARKNVDGAIVLGIGVLSHWFLDLIVHRPDLPLHPGNSPRVGLGLWHSLPGTLLVEIALLIAGVLLYLRATRARNRTGVYAFWGLVGFLVIIYAGSVLGPPPPDVQTIAWAGQLQWLLVLLGYWVDRNRSSTSLRKSA